MKVDKIKVYLFEFILLTILSFALFVSNAYSRIILAVILAIGATGICFLIKKRNVESVDSKKVTTILIIFAIIYLIAFYAMGLYFGYYKATFTFSTRTLTNYIIPTAIIIISSEVIRNILLKQNTKFTQTITLIIMVLVDLAIYTDIYNTNTFQEILEIIGFTFFASVACNLLYNYVSNRYGIKGNIIYTFAKNNMIVAAEDKRKSLISKIVLGFMTLIIAMLISCQFKYGILVIGSGSMTGAINKGDAIFFEQYDENEEIKIGQVIIFNKDNKKIVHRVVDFKKVNGETRYTTKGDANQEQDDGYITNKDITGICKFKIAYIGYPSIWIRDILSN